MFRKLPLNLVYLKYFCDAYRLGSVSKSAKENFVSQSAISQGITKLEDLLYIKLITHEPNRFKPTPEGVLLFEKSKKIFEAIEEVEQSVINGEKGYQGQVQFACMHSFALAFLSKPIALLREKYPGLYVKFRSAGPDQIKKLLQTGEIDFGIVLNNDDFSAYDSEIIYKGEYQLYRSKNSKSEQYILSEQRKETNLLKQHYSNMFQKELPVLMEVASWEVIASLVEEGLGIGFFPDYIAKKKDLERIDLGLPSIPYEVLALFPKGANKHKNSKVFLEIFANINKKETTAI